MRVQKVRNYLHMCIIIVFCNEREGGAYRLHNVHNIVLQLYRGGDGGTETIYIICIIIVFCNEGERVEHTDCIMCII